MTETTTPTGDNTDQDSSDIRDESLLEQETGEQETTAVEQQDDTDVSESNDADSDSSSSTDDGSDDKGLAKFAKSQGFEDYDSLSDDAKRALQIARKQVQKDRKDLQDKADQRKLSEEMKNLTTPSDEDDTNAVIMKKMALLEANEMTRDFWSQNANDRDKYEGKMAEILAKERETYGDAAAWNLAQNLPRLLREAKFAAGEFDSGAARDAGRREERERLRKIQEGSADSAHASQSVATSSKKLTREVVDNMSDEEYVKRRDEIDAAIARGELY